MKIKTFKDFLLESLSEEAWELLGQPIMSQFRKKYKLFNDETSAKKVETILSKLSITTLAAEQIPQLNNLANKSGDKAALATIVNYRKNPTDNTEQIFMQAMQARDSSEERNRDYIDSIFKNVIAGNYEPPLLFKQNNKLIVIGGRTRLYAALILDKTIKVIIASEEDFL